MIKKIFFTVLLKLDPEPEFWPNLDPDPGLCDHFEEQKVKNILEKNKFIFYKKKIIVPVPKEFLVSLVQCCGACGAEIILRSWNQNRSRN